MLTEPLYTFLIMIIFGLSMAAPPGPVNALIALESVKGWTRGTLIGAGAMTADFIFFILTLVLRQLVPGWAVKYFYLVGGVYVMYIAVAVRAGRSRYSARNTGSYIVGLVMGLSNPYQISWWLTFGVAMVSRFGAGGGAGFFAGILIWILVYPLSIQRLGALSSKLQAIIADISTAVLILMGIFMVLSFLKTL
ncbi:MAG: LysE family transporter [Nitrososphaeria archaeon]